MCVEGDMSVRDGGVTYVYSYVMKRKRKEEEKEQCLGEGSLPL